jgi:hypothetical protein
MGSRSVPATYGGNGCPERLNFGRVHGPSAAVGYLEIDGDVNVQMGTPGMIQIGPASYYGFVTKIEKSQNAESGNRTVVRMVDWRDRLQDNYLFGAFNMHEDDGRFWHILPYQWLDQIKTYVSRQFKQVDFNQLQAGPGQDRLLKNIGKDGLFSPATILNAIAQQFNFVWTAEERALRILKSTRPLNLDWNAGAKVGDAIEQMLSKVQLQWTCFGVKNLHVTVRGFTDNAYVSSFAQGLTDICTLGAEEGSIGQELNEHGRRVALVGEPNRYEYTFPCRQNWNPAWTWEFCYGAWQRSALLKQLGLTILSKVKELPKKFHDDQIWTENNDEKKGDIPEKQTRNEMTIQDYLDKIAFKVYVVDFRYAMTTFKRVNHKRFEGTYGEIDYDNTMEIRNPRNITGWQAWKDWDSVLLDSEWPISNALVTESNRQSITYATSYKISTGKMPPFDDIHTFVPKSDGVSMDIEEILDVDPDLGGQNFYRVRLFFSEVQLFDPDWVHQENVGADKLPDTVLITLPLDQKLYTYVYGEAGNGPRVRTKKVSVRSLYKAFENGKEVTVLKRNFMRNLVQGGVQLAANAVKADDIAKEIAKQLVASQAVNVAGGLRFKDRCGMMCDGMVDSVNDTFDPVSGIEEFVNFSSSAMDDREIVNPIPIRVGRETKMEDDIARDRLLALHKEAMRNPAVARQAMNPVDRAMHHGGGVMSDVQRANAAPQNRTTAIINTRDNPEGVANMVHGKDKETSTARAGALLATSGSSTDEARQTTKERMEKVLTDEGVEIV